MELDLTSKRALITGSSRGIGLAIAEELIAEGCQVVLNGRDQAVLSGAVAATGAVRGICGDVTDPEGAQRIVAQAVDALGGLDILVCNVGSGSSIPPGEETFDEWQRVFSINLWSVTNMVEATRAALTKSCGAIVCVSSICGVETIPGAPVTYSTAKAALHAYISGIARPLGQDGIRINAVAPGNILFDGSVWARKLKEDGQAVNDMLAREVAVSRLGEPKEVASLVTYLASPRAGFASGSVWTLDGGQVRS